MPELATASRTICGGTSPCSTTTGSDRPAVPPAGRGRHAVLHHDRRRVHAGRHGHRSRPRHAEAGCGSPPTPASYIGERLPAMSAGLSIERLRREGEAFMRGALARVLCGARGAQAKAELQPSTRGIADPRARRAGAHARAFSAAPGERGATFGAPLLDWQAESQSVTRAAPLDEREIAWEGARWCDCRRPRGPISARRRSTWPQHGSRGAPRAREARATLVERELAPMRRERLQRERDITESLGWPTATSRRSGAAQGSRCRAGGECERFLRDTQAMWEDVHSGAVKRSSASRRTRRRAPTRSPCCGRRVRSVLSRAPRWSRR